MWNGKKIGVVIVAGGSGSRMGAAVPKQFLRLCDEPILCHTLRKFLPYADHLVVVLPQGEIALWEKIVEEYHLEGTHTICTGGATRFHSVQRGLESLDGECEVVVVHDGVRPLVSQKMIERGVGCAIEHGTAIPVIAAVDSFRIVEQGELVVTDRNNLRAVQTPQIFASSLLRNAYHREAEECFTDDATVVEAMGAKMHYYQGERYNIKITTPEDLVVAEALLKTTPNK